MSDHRPVAADFKVDVSTASVLALELIPQGRAIADCLNDAGRLVESRAIYRRSEEVLPRGRPFGEYAGEEGLTGRQLLFGFWNIAVSLSREVSSLRRK